MSLTHINFDWSFYFAMILMVTLWNCGFTAITRKGKIGYFVLQFFEQKKLKRVEMTETEMHEVDKDLRANLNITEPVISQAGLDYIKDYIQLYMERSLIYSLDDWLKIFTNLRAGVNNKYYYKVHVDRFSDLIRDPIVGCITCMASFHSIILYTAVVLYSGFLWNPFEWVVVAIPCAFCGECLWKVNKLMQLHVEQLTENKK